MYGYCYSAYNRLSFLGGFDSNASAFFAATGITDPAIQGAINTLCVDLKKYGVFDKMKAIYPFVGGTATTHKFNLKDSRDLDAAFRLTFNGGITHDSNGITPNGTNGFANTFIIANDTLSLNSTHISIYSRTNTDIFAPSIANSTGGFAGETSLWLKTTNLLFARINNNIISTLSNTNSTGYYIGSRNSSTQLAVFKNNTKTTFNQNSNGLGFISYKIGGINTFFDNKQYAFATIGDGLTDEESANLYYSVQKFQTTLGRQVGTPIYSSNATDVNARLFLGATNIQDATITSAVDTLVQGLKTDGIWSKLKAVYPFVGGTATTHKFNLANALDEDNSFRLAFSGGITHDANGMLPNGVNAFANTFLNSSTNLVKGSAHLSVYSRTNSNLGSPYDMGNSSNLAGTADPTYLITRYSSNVAIIGIADQSFATSIASTDSRGFFSGGTNGSSTQKIFKNGSIIKTGTTGVGSLANNALYISASNNAGTASLFSNKQIAFSTIGDGLSDTEASNLYTRVQAFQTTLNRQV